MLSVQYQAFRNVKTLGNGLVVNFALRVILPGDAYLWSDVLCRFGRGDGFHAHGEKCADEQNRRAPELHMGKAFVENPGGESHGAGGA